MPPLHPDLEAEQAHLDLAYRCLATMRERAEQAADLAASGAAQEVDSAIAEWHLRRRVRELTVDVPGLAFGRVDHDDARTSYHVGRRHVEGDDGATLVVDWRAPVATPFYRATPADPLGLRMRRRFATNGDRIEALFDEVFDDPDSMESVHGGVPDPLLAELERARTGTMRDIVATIQAEQDVVIRAPLGACLVVQGGPGTGKTAVGLHRAAFLLYEHRHLLDDVGVLVVGPNPTFLRYISQVLPSLGETSVRQTTMDGLVGRPLDADGDPRRAALLGDARLAAVVARALDDLITVPGAGDEPIGLTTSFGRVRLAAADVAAAVEEIRSRRVPHNVGRTALRTRLFRLARLALEERRGEAVVPTDVLEADLRTGGAFGKVLARFWPSASGPALVKRLLTSRAVLLAASDDLLDDAERALLLRRGGRRIDDEPWTPAELVVVDEARAAVDGPAKTYGHLVVDEAQDLSAMALRALARRCPSGSMTVLGDLAQATAPAAQSNWEEALANLGSPAGSQLAELGIGYRVPAPILDWANRLLAEAAPGVRPASSVRLSGDPPEIVAAAEGDALVDGVAQVVEGLAGRSYSTIGVIAPESLVDALAERLGVRRSAAGPVQLVGATESKGLEFDAVVVVEPAAIAAASPDRRAGLRLLYVTLTRAVQHLTVVHAQPLPQQLLV